MLFLEPSGHSSGMSRSRVPVKVYLVDPSNLVRGRVAAMLCAAGMSVVGEAKTPQSAVEGILGCQPDVVVLDVHLTGGNGLQVLRTVRQVVPGIGFVVFSNDAAPAYRKRYLGEGANQFLDKTSEFDQLVLAVASAARRGNECCSK
jgi:DNA-binding NarL/FixJ family response regulator